jgi:hypothetical protein
MKKCYNSTGGAVLRWNNVVLQILKLYMKRTLSGPKWCGLAEHKATGELYEIRQLKWDQTEEIQVTSEL